MQLNKLQQRFKDLMLNHPDALDAPPEDLAAVFKTGDIPLPARLKVYRNNIVGSLTDMMLASFPILQNLVGVQFLEGMARSFILENPPEQGCLNFYGHGFAEFIEKFELAKSLPYLADVARLELAMNEAYYAADDDALQAEDLAEIAPEDLAGVELSLRENVKFVSSRWPLLKIKEFCAQENPQGTLNMDQGGGAVMVSRPHLETQASALGADEYEMLKALQSGQRLGAAVEGILSRHSDFDFQAFLQKHIGLKSFKAF